MESTTHNMQALSSQQACHESKCLKTNDSFLFLEWFKRAL